MLINDTRIRNTKPAGKPQKLFDGGGLFLLLQPNGSRWWRLKYRFDGREKTLSLGVYPEVSLKQARERREALRRTIADGVDPSAIRKSEKRARTNTFEAVAREWYEQRVPNWTPEYAKLLLRRLERNLFPWIGSKPVAKLTAADVLDCLQRIQKRGALETAHRARGTCGEVMRYAVATRRAERDPVADLRGALPPTKPTHFASIKDPVKVGELMRAIAGYDAKAEAVRAALRLAPYVFVRPTELRKADWSEFNLEAAEWRLPPERTKMGFPHIVPLSRQAVQILRELCVITGPHGLVFPSIRTGARAISNNTINAALRKLGYTREEMTGHGFRSMASTILNEQGWHPDAIERQLAHIEQNDVRAAYNYAEYLPIRRRMMQSWSDYLDALRDGRQVQVHPVGRAVHAKEVSVDASLSVP
jgi:integrase